MATETTRYIEAIGRRKTATARVRITPSTQTDVIINKKDIKDFFPINAHQVRALEPFLKSGVGTTFSVEARVTGGGVAGQADAIRLGISRALIVHDINLRGALKSEGMLKRDPRAKERKKPGLVKARKRKQWSKR